MKPLYLFISNFRECCYELVYVIFCVEASWAYPYSTIGKGANHLVGKGGTMKARTYCNVKGLIENSSNLLRFKSFYIHR